MTSDADLTPLMRQYQTIKHRYQDAILFFRVGDFYEMFFDDAEVASKILSIALTSRDKARSDPIPLCGVPYHAATGYIARLLKAGHTVALCEQTEDPRDAKGIVRRDVVRLYTPGTLFDTELLPAKEANFLAAIACVKAPSGLPGFGIAAVELSTGDFWMAEFSGDDAPHALQAELAKLGAQELLVSQSMPEEAIAEIQTVRIPRVSYPDDHAFESSLAQTMIRHQFGEAGFDPLRHRAEGPGISAAGALLHYLKTTQPGADLSHLRRIRLHQPSSEMQLDAMTIRNLELVRPMMPDQQGGTLLAVLDRTISAMGSRLLREWILRPLVSRDQIDARLAAVSDLVSDLKIRTAVRDLLRPIQDLERLSTRISLGTASPRDLLALNHSLSNLSVLRETLGGCGALLLQELLKEWDDLVDIAAVIEAALLPGAPNSTREGGIFREGYHHALDELRRSTRDGTTWIAQLELRERERTGIESLKIRYNQVFGYYIEVTKANLSRIPQDYIRKQTLVNAERFMTAELKTLEDQVTGAESKMKSLEQELFQQLQQDLTKETPRIQHMARSIAAVDVLAALADAAAANRYSRPTVDDSGLLTITQGRHPVIELMGHQDGFVPNDTFVDLEASRIHIVTGPNMAGKSTYLRQVALITLMAQMGSFVPATQARIGIADRIFTRVGASDNLAQGQSTFMVEMMETAQILRSATRRSLILLDEIGRGTSTYDGLSIAWAVTEYIQDQGTVGARTLFATHYHEMTDLAAIREGIKNYTVLVKEDGHDILFLRKIVEGATDRSYGIHVARLAGLPLPVITRAEQVLAQLEQSSTAHSPPTAASESLNSGDIDTRMPRPHPIVEEVRQMDLFSMTPLDALNRLASLQQRLDDEPPPLEEKALHGP